MMEMGGNTWGEGQQGLSGLVTGSGLLASSLKEPAILRPSASQPSGQGEGG